MATEIVNLIPAKQAESTQTTQFTAEGIAAVIDKFTVTNTTQNNEQLTVNIVDFQTLPDESNVILDTITVEPGKTYLCPEIVGHSLDQGSFISTIASKELSLTIMSSGRKIS